MVLPYIAGLASLASGLGSMGSARRASRQEVSGLKAQRREAQEALPGLQEQNRMDAVRAVELLGGGAGTMFHRRADRVREAGLKREQDLMDLIHQLRKSEKSARKRGRIGRAAGGAQAVGAFASALGSLMKPAPGVAVQPPAGKVMWDVANR